MLNFNIFKKLKCLTIEEEILDQGLKKITSEEEVDPLIQMAQTVWEIMVT